jgi:hypothetical protein
MPRRLPPELLLLDLVAGQQAWKAVDTVDPVPWPADEVSAHWDGHHHSALGRQRFAHDRHCLEVAVHSVGAPVSPGETDVLDRGAVENLVEPLGAQWPIEDVCLEELDALVMEGARNGELVESDHLMAALGSGKG